MKKVFADSNYWMAVVKPKDPWSEAADHARKSLRHAILVATDEVLIEFLTALSRGGPTLRQAAAKMVRAILGDANVRVIQQTREGFLNGVARLKGVRIRNTALQIASP